MSDLVQLDQKTEKIITTLFLKMKKSGRELRDCFNLELALLNHLLDCEKKITTIREKRRSLRIRRKEILKLGSLDIDETIKKKLISIHQREQELKQSENSLFFRHALLKRIGDSLAWILTGYNRRYIRNMCRKEPTGFIWGKSGFELERTALKAVFDEKRKTIGILHDLTNCLRIGDLTVIQFDEFPRVLDCVELKKIRKEITRLRRRTRRQKKYGGIVLEYIMKGKSTKMIPGYTTVSITPRLTNHWLEMKSLLYEAMKLGYAYKKLEETLLYVAYNPHSFETGEIVKKIEKDLGHPFTFGCLDRHVNGLFDHETIFTFDLEPDQILDIIFGRLIFCTFVNIERLRALIKQKGCAFSAPYHSKQAEKGLEFLDENGVEMFIGSYPIELLLYEGMDIRSFLKSIDIAKEMVKDKLRI